jgi:hypothetical protein
MLQPGDEDVGREFVFHGPSSSAIKILALGIGCVWCGSPWFRWGARWAGVGLRASFLLGRFSGGCWAILSKSRQAEACPTYGLES